ncbi:GNAT family N-acetyltransferase [Streptomyces sp. bgisy029]|uniref:GNAT family N-acetyltransferase n=1 Tax=Streptomyces sp. bgisy029 TaxID=3413771 RepID=UPI003D73E875
MDTEEAGKELRSGRIVRITHSTDADYELFVQWLSPGGRVAALTGDAGEQVTIAALRREVEVNGSRYCTIRTLAGRPVGMVKFFRVGPDAYEISGAIGEDGLWTRGFGAEGFGLLIEHLFADLGAHRLQFRVGSHNRAMLDMVIRLRFFMLEGILRDRQLINGERHDLLVWAMLRDEYEALFVRGEWESRPTVGPESSETDPERKLVREMLTNYLSSGVRTSLTAYQPETVG